MKNKILFIILFAVIGLIMIVRIINIEGGIGGGNINARKQITMDSARRFAEELGEKINGYIETLQSLSKEMSLYENLTLEARRREYENKMLSAFENMSDLVQVFSVWKPNAIDGLDNRYKGKSGATETGQFAFALTNEYGQIEKQTVDSGVVQAAMAHLTGSNSTTIKISDLSAVINFAEGEKECFSIMVPILNDRTNEAVGVVGCLIDTSILQILTERVIKYNDEVSSSAIYTNTGFILASYVPRRIRYNLVDVEVQYGAHINNVVDAVKNAQEFECFDYDPVLKVKMFMCIVPIFLKDSPSTWSVMIGSTEDYLKKRRR
jgi:methyl-accepting chemotaxis protein